ncbi:hypothetical protein BCV70DRAFT_203147 [Testicularia cyperi]|uniref:Uncharacterized protein n=1 Tax=Testicularia cyperi TaxID=1882483 RepID=A0A317XFA3_9BASI|nr:hypothetical protein BCV70DRAFT_203147 [Testicularia cyperi]
MSSSGCRFARAPAAGQVRNSGKTSSGPRVALCCCTVVRSGSQQLCHLVPTQVTGAPEPHRGAPDRSQNLMTEIRRIGDALDCGHRWTEVDTPMQTTELLLFLTLFGVLLRSFVFSSSRLTPLSRNPKNVLTLSRRTPQLHITIAMESSVVVVKENDSSAPLIPIHFHPRLGFSFASVGASNFVCFHRCLWASFILIGVGTMQLPHVDSLVSPCPMLSSLSLLFLHVAGIAA